MLREIISYSSFSSCSHISITCITAVCLQQQTDASPRQKKTPKNHWAQLHGRYLLYLLFHVPPLHSLCILEQGWSFSPSPSFPDIVLPLVFCSWHSCRLFSFKVALGRSWNVAPRTITEIVGIHIIPWSCEDPSLSISAKTESKQYKTEMLDSIQSLIAQEISMRHTDLSPKSNWKFHLALLNIVPKRTVLTIISVISFQKQNTRITYAGCLTILQTV